eukprot:1782060-Amphidinium_carterae.1
MTPKIGTTEYMAPETYQGKVRQECADRTDLWSLGVLLHVVFVGTARGSKRNEKKTFACKPLPTFVAEMH